MATPRRLPRPGRPARITRRSVAEAVIAVGLDKATLTEVARHLGVDHSSLYRHTSGRADMLLAAADLAIGSLDWETDTDDWRAYLEGAAEAIWGMFDRHPGLANVLRQLEATPPAGLRAFCRACRRLEALGFTVDQAVLVFDSVLDLTIDASCYYERLRAPSKRGRTVAKVLHQTWQDQGAHDPDAAPYIRAFSAALGDSKQWWRKKLALVLDGAVMMRADVARSPRKKSRSVRS